MKKGKIISSRVIGKIYKSIREVLYKYLFIIYQHDAYRWKSIHSYKKGEAVWIFGVMKDKNEFRIEATTNRNSDALKLFIEKKVIL